MKLSLGGVRSRETPGRTPACRNGKQADVEIRRVDDRIAGPPACSGEHGDITQSRSTATTDRDFLELAVCNETNPIPIGREKGAAASFGAGDRNTFEAVQRTHINGSLCPVVHDIGDLFPVR